MNQQLELLTFHAISKRKSVRRSRLVGWFTHLSVRPNFQRFFRHAILKDAASNYFVPYQVQILINAAISVIVFSVSNFFVNFAVTIIVNSVTRGHRSLYALNAKGAKAIGTQEPSFLLAKNGL